MRIDPLSICRNPPNLMILHPRYPNPLTLPCQLGDPTGSEDFLEPPASGRTLVMPRAAILHRNVDASASSDPGEQRGIRKPIALYEEAAALPPCSLKAGVGWLPPCFWFCSGGCILAASGTAVAFDGLFQLLLLDQRPCGTQRGTLH